MPPSASNELSTRSFNKHGKHGILNGILLRSTTILG
jgi:hypothetical protein